MAKEKEKWEEMGFKTEEEYLERMYENEPQPEDYVISACGELGSKICVGEVEGKYLGEFNTQEEAEAFIQEHAKNTQYFPNVWFLSDHGNWHLRKDFKYERTRRGRKRKGVE